MSATKPRTIHAKIEDHAQWIIENHYHKPYPAAPAVDGINRYVHGAQHISRAALFVSVWLNIYRSLGHEAALNLTEEDHKLLQIAALFHDSARQDENEDFWDRDSALNCYNYLISLGVEPVKAKNIAEAAANKDVPQNGDYYVLDIQSMPPSWQLTTRKEKNIWQSLLQNADCLEILRARDIFQATYLDFYQQYVMQPNGEVNQTVLTTLAQVICEARALIYHQGDLFRMTDSETKKKYEFAENCFLQTAADLAAFNYLSHFYAVNKLCSKEILAAHKPERSLPQGADKELTHMMDQGQLFTRGIVLPAAMAEGKTKTLAQIEIAKTNRQQGNLNRSVSNVHHGAPPFSNAGFFIFAPENQNICSVSAADHHTGHGKKKHLQVQAKTANLSQDMLKLRTTMMLGGSVPANGVNFSHTEIILHIKQVDAVYFCPEPTWSSSLQNPELPWTQGQAALAQLEAIYIQQAFAAMSSDKQLPIYEYSPAKNAIFKRTFTQQDIIKLWENYLNFELDKLRQDKTKTLHLLANNNELELSFITSQSELLAYYPPELKKTILALFKNLLKQKCHTLAAEWQHTLDSSYWWNHETAKKGAALYLFYPEISPEFKETCVERLNSALSSETYPIVFAIDETEAVNFVSPLLLSLDNKLNMADRKKLDEMLAITDFGKLCLLAKQSSVFPGLSRKLQEFMQGLYYSYTTEWEQFKFVENETLIAALVYCHFNDPSQAKKISQKYATTVLENLNNKNLKPEDKYAAIMFACELNPDDEALKARFKTHLNEFSKTACDHKKGNIEAYYFVRCCARLGIGVGLNEQHRKFLSLKAILLNKNREVYDGSNYKLAEQKLPDLAEARESIQLYQALNLADLLKDSSYAKKLIEQIMEMLVIPAEMHNFARDLSHHEGVLTILKQVVEWMPNKKLPASSLGNLHKKLQANLAKIIDNCQKVELHIDLLHYKTYVNYCLDYDFLLPVPTQFLNKFEQEVIKIASQENSRLTPFEKERYQQLLAEAKRASEACSQPKSLFAAFSGTLFNKTNGNSSNKAAQTPSPPATTLLIDEPQTAAEVATAKGCTIL